MELLRRTVQSEVFDYQMLASFLKDLKKPRDKVSALLAERKILRIRKGLYVFGEDWRRTPMLI
jgi:hypothetical protein